MEKTKHKSSYQYDFKLGERGNASSAIGLGTISELQEESHRRLTMEENGNGSVKVKLRNKTMKALRDQLLKNPQYQSKGFGLPTDHTRPRPCEADVAGGDMNYLISA